MALKILTAADIEKVLTMQTAIAAMRDAFVELGLGNVDMPLRTVLPILKQQAITLSMPVYLPKIEKIGIKIVSVFPNNPKQGLPSISGLVLLLNAKTGQPEILMDGAFLTALRTGAVSGLATDLLAQKNASSVAIIGAGVQARTQLEAVCCVREIKQVWIYSRTLVNAERFANEFAKKKSILINVTKSAHEATKDADIICTATTSTVPIIDFEDVKPGAHINAVGSHTKEMCEIGASLMSQSKIIVDSRSAALAEAGEIIQSIDHGIIKESDLSELADIILKPPKDKTANQMTLFKSVGLAIQDVTAAYYAMQVAQQNNQGLVVEL